MSDILLVSPHQFANLNREQLLANEFNLTLKVAENQQEFSELAPKSSVVMVTPYGKLTADTISSMATCRGIVRYGIGYDNIDIAACTSAGIPVSIVPDASTEEVASHAFALGLALSRRIPAGQNAVAGGNWAAQVPGDLPVMSQLEVGVVGLGRIGRLVAGWWQAVGAQVAVFDPIADVSGFEQKTLDQLIEKSDVLSLHLPLTEQTRHMISAETIGRMRDRSIVVNVSRGGLIDETALAEALQSGHLAGAGIDVFEREPLPLDSPLRSAPNIMLTPHSAWKSRSSLDALQSGAVSRARSILLDEKVPDLVS